MPDLAEELKQLADDAARVAVCFESEGFNLYLEQLEEAVEGAAKSWCNSWLGYHSRIYYKDLEPVPPGARFDSSRGFEPGLLNKTVGDWREYTFDGVYEMLKSVISETDFESIVAKASEAIVKVRDFRENLLSILESLAEGNNDNYLMRLIGETKEASPIPENKFVDYFRPSGKVMTSDYVAIQGGFQTPPHIVLLAKIKAIESPFTVAKTISKLAMRAERHLVNRIRVPKRDDPGTNVFIGHGRSTSWRDLKDFIQDRLGLPWDEFNRIPVAGVTNIARLSEMLKEAAIAFIVMTAEDEQIDGTKQARMNVIHEAGLFQGRLGFSKAIIVFEEGCEEFSNIQGLGQIRFPVGNIRASFEEIRQVLEREGLLDS